jgi:hypothetical protein
MYPDAGITGSVQSLARNGRLAAYHQRQDRSVSWWRSAPPALSGASRAGLSASSAAPPGTVYHSGYLPDGNAR